MVQKKWVLVSYNDEDFKKQNDDLTKSYVHFCHSIPIVLQDGPTWVPFISSFSHPIQISYILSKYYTYIQ